MLVGETCAGETVKAALETGANRFVVGPVSPAKLCERLIAAAKRGLDFSAIFRDKIGFWRGPASPPIVPRAQGGARQKEHSVVSLFGWWRNATPGTLMTTWFSGRRVGEDKFGNRYYQTRDGKRRWVVYNGTVEASRVPSDWHGWLHHTFENPPTVEPLKAQRWETEHEPNLTGTEHAYHPDGSLWSSGQRPPATGDYDAWKPR